MAASPGRKEEPVAARVLRWAGGERRGVAVVKVVKPVMLVTLEVQDTQRRVVARTMRRTSKLQGLMDYYYDVVCCSGDAGKRGTAGRFVFDGKCLKGEHTPEGLGMVSGDKIDFFGDSIAAAHGAGGEMEEVDRKRKPVITPGQGVQLTLKVKDTTTPFRPALMPFMTGWNKTV